MADEKKKRKSVCDMFAEIMKEQRISITDGKLKDAALALLSFGGGSAEIPPLWPWDHAHWSVLQVLETRQQYDIVKMLLTIEQSRLVIAERQHRTLYAEEKIRHEENEARVRKALEDAHAERAKRIRKEQGCACTEDCEDACAGECGCVVCAELWVDFNQSPRRGN